MYTWEKNVNRGGHCVVDYGYPPIGNIVSSVRATPADFDEIDEMGWNAWNAKDKEESKAWYAKNDQYAGQPFENMRAFFAAKRKVMAEQGIIAPGEERDGYYDILPGATDQDRDKYLSVEKIKE